MVEKMQEKIDMKTMIHSIIGVAIMLGISNMTPIEPVTTIGMHVGGIFLGLIYLWTTVGIFWPTLLGIVLLGLTDGIGMDTMFTAFSAYIALLILFCMFFCGAVADSGLTQYIAHWFLSRKFINGHPIVFNIMIMTAIYVVSGVIDALAAALVVWPIMYATLEKVGYTKDEKYPRVLTVCSFIALSLGICLLPIWGAMAAMVEVFENASGMHVSYLSYILLNTIVGFVIIVVMSFMIKYVFHCDLTKMENITIEDICSEKLPPMSKTQIVYAIATVIFFLVAILPSVLPQEWPAVIWLNKLTLIGFLMLALCVLSFLKLDGNQVYEKEKVSRNNVSFEMLFLVVLTLYLSGTLLSEETGIKTLLINIVTPLFAHTGSVVFMIVIIFIGLLLTNYGTNLVIGMVLLQVVAAIAPTIGLNPLPIGMVVLMAMYAAFLSPAASPYAPLLHTKTDYTSAKEIYQYGVILLLTCGVIFLVVGVPVAYILF